MLQESNIQARVSVKRKWALLGSNPPSNNRKTRLQTAAAEGGVEAPPSGFFKSCPLLLIPNIQYIMTFPPSITLPVVRVLWLKKSRCIWPEGPNTRPKSLRTSVPEPLRMPPSVLQACLIACNTRHFDEVAIKVQPHRRRRPQ